MCNIDTKTYKSIYILLYRYVNMWFRKPLNSVEYEDITKKFILLDSRLRQMELTIDDFRAKVLQKIQKKQEKEQETPPIQDAFDYLRTK